ncbi:hypothetical protein ABIC76_003589 [Ralstonia sp. 1138]
MPSLFQRSRRPARIAKMALLAGLAIVVSACVVVPRGPDGAPYTARVPSDEQGRTGATLPPEQRKRLDDLNAQALRESDQAAEREAQVRQYVAPPSYAPAPYYGSYSVFYGGGWGRRGGWGVGYGWPVWGYPYFW